LGTRDPLTHIFENVWQIKLQMRYPGVWIMGDSADDDRRHGMGMVVEYAGHGGKAQWIKPPAFHWDYLRFGRMETAREPDEVIEMAFAKRNAAENGFNQWTIERWGICDGEADGNGAFAARAAVSFEDAKRER